jgi:hypothetical protein
MFTMITSELTTYLFSVMLVYVGLANASFLFFSNDVMGYRNFGFAFISLWESTPYGIHGPEIDPLSKSNRFFGPFFAMVFNFFMRIIMVNIFIALINSAHWRAERLYGMDGPKSWETIVRVLSQTFSDWYQARLSAMDDSDDSDNEANLGDIELVEKVLVRRKGGKGSSRAVAWKMVYDIHQEGTVMHDVKARINACQQARRQGLENLRASLQEYVPFE